MQQNNRRKISNFSIIPIREDEAYPPPQMKTIRGADGFSKSKEIEDKQKEIEKLQIERDIENWDKNWKLYQQNKEKILREYADSLLKKAMVLITKHYKPIFHKKILDDDIFYFEKKFGSKERAIECINETEKVAKDMVETYVKRWIPILIDSLSMHWFPERVEKGVRRPGEWKPDFNLEVVARMEYQCGKLIAYRIKENAWKQSLDRRELLALFHEKVKE
jgi:hypothetical protein